MSNGSFIPIGSAADKVVINLAAHRKPRVVTMDSPLVQQLKDTNALLAEQNYKRLEADRARVMITKYIGVLRDNTSPQEAADFLADTLAAIAGVA